MSHHRSNVHHFLPLNVQLLEKFAWLKIVRRVYMSHERSFVHLFLPHIIQITQQKYLSKFVSENELSKVS